MFANTLKTQNKIKRGKICKKVYINRKNVIYKIEKIKCKKIKKKY